MTVNCMRWAFASGERPVATDPCEGALDDPALGQELEARHNVALYDLEAPGAVAAVAHHVLVMDQAGWRTSATSMYLPIWAHR